MFEFLSRSAKARALAGVSPSAAAPEKKSITAPLIALTLAGRAEWGPRDYAGLVRSGVMGNAIAYRCVRMIAESAASIPWLLYDGAAELTDHPLLSLLVRPNVHESGASLFERWYAFLQCAGNAYLHAACVNGQVRSLDILRPDRVQIVKDANGYPAAYTYTVNTEAAQFGRDAAGFLPVMQGKLFHPLDDLFGYPPAEAAANAIDIHNAGAGWTKSLLDNAARPSGALIYKGPDGAPGLSEEQFGRLKSELEGAYQGAANAGRPMVLEGGLDWQSMSFTPSDMDFSAIRNAAAREIALAFGIPPMLLGIPGDNTYANYREANLAFWRGTAIPLVSRTAQDLTRWLSPKFGETLRIGFDADQVAALAQDREATWDKLNAATFLTLNEKRAAAGYGAVDNGDTAPQ
jgi:HK97 family phage portal protein